MSYTPRSSTITRTRATAARSTRTTPVGIGLVGASACGDAMKLQINVDPRAQTNENTEIAERQTLPPAKIRCSVPAEDAIKAAIADCRHEAAELATVSAEREKVARAPRE